MSIKAFSFTCLRDVHMVERIHNQLTEMGISHTMYVDESEVDRFPFQCKSRGHHPNGTNGFGRSGTYAKLACIRDMVDNTHLGDTILDCDSDVLFEDSNDILDLKCNDSEYKGWCGKVLKINGTDFHYCSGAVKSYSHELATKIIQHDISGAIDTLINSGFTPSEDCVTSYIAGLEGNVINMSNKYVWKIIQTPIECVVRVCKNVT